MQFELLDTFLSEINSNEKLYTILTAERKEMCKNRKYFTLRVKTNGYFDFCFGCFYKWIFEIDETKKIVFVFSLFIQKCAYSLIFLLSPFILLILLKFSMRKVLDIDGVIVKFKRSDYKIFEEMNLKMATMQF